MSRFFEVIGDLSFSDFKGIIRSPLFFLGSDTISLEISILACSLFEIDTGSLTLCDLVSIFAGPRVSSNC
jgi:hypothetical protein